MEASDTMTSEELHKKVAELEAELEDQEQKTIQAATFGKSLLEENGDLRDRIDDLMKRHAKELEEKQQEICSLMSRAEISACTEKWQQEEITNLRTELQQVQDTVKEQVEEDKKQEISGYKKQVENLHLDVEQLQAVEQELRTRLAEQEALLQTHLDRTTVQSISTSSESEEMAALTEELTTLKMDLTELQAKNIDVSSQLQQCLREKDAVTSRLKTSELEMEDLQCQVVSYTRHLEESRNEVMELRAQLDANLLNSQSHSSKGNSIFSELEDRRLVLEKMMASLKVQNQQLKEKYNMEKQLNNKYKMQVAMALQMSHHKDDAATQRMRGELSAAHAEIRSLTAKLQDLESSKTSGALQLNADELMGAMEDKNYAQYLMSIIQSEKETAAKARAELQGKSMQYLDTVNQNMKLSQQLQQLQAEKDKLQSQLIKAAMEKEELVAKYEPDKTKEGKTVKKVIEKIDVGDLATATPSISMGRPSDVFKPMPTLGRNSMVPVKRPPRQDKLCSSTFQSSLDHGKLTDTENIFPQGRRVNMADDVKVIHAGGEETTAALMGDGERAVPSESLRKKQAKASKPARHIKAADAQEVECKTQ